MVRFDPVAFLESFPRLCRLLRWVKSRGDDRKVRKFGREVEDLRVSDGHVYVGAPRPLGKKRRHP